ncbi:MAG: 50S ribosomal protein L13 [bacterium]|nr:50S ribosomal protein L13 [bacterium]
MTEIKRKTHKIDATSQTIGRMATQIAIFLRGKHKPEYQHHIDLGDSVVVENIKKAKFTGTKFEKKEYHSFSGYPGGLKTTKLNALFTKNPTEVLRKAVWNMLPKNKLRSEMIKRLTIS